MPWHWLSRLKDDDPAATDEARRADHAIEMLDRVSADLRDSVARLQEITTGWGEMDNGPYGQRNA